jgi:serine/threonine-protein kinase
MLIDEARMSGRVRHANVVATLDVVVEPDDVLLVMEYVTGETLYTLLAETVGRGEPVPIPVAVRIGMDILRGLQAAHDATDEEGNPLHIVHRDVSPQNVMVGVDGVSRLLDFGVAKARGRLQSTRDGQLKGKLSYMSPEQIRGSAVPQTDVFAAAAVLWEALTGRRLFDAENEGAMLNLLLNAPIARPSEHRSEVPSQLDLVVMRGLSRVIEDRYARPDEMAQALSRASAIAENSAVAAWVRHLAHDRIRVREALIHRVEAVPPELLQPAPGVSQPIDLSDSYDDFRTVSSASRASVDIRPSVTSAPHVAPFAPLTPSGPANLDDTDSISPEAFRRRPWPLFAIALPLLAAGGLALWWASTDSDPQHADPVTTRPADLGEDNEPDIVFEQTADPVAPPLPATVSQTRPPAVVPPTQGTPRPARSAPSTSSVPTASAPPPPVEPKPPADTPPSVTPPKRPGCEQPMYIDENGIKRYRVECL